MEGIAVGNSSDYIPPTMPKGTGLAMMTAYRMLGDRRLRKIWPLY